MGSTYDVPHLLDEVRRQLAKFTGTSEMMFGIAVHARLKHYRRVLGLPYSRAAEAAIAITLHHSHGTTIA